MGPQHFFFDPLKMGLLGLAGGLVGEWGGGTPRMGGGGPPRISHTGLTQNTAMSLGPFNLKICLGYLQIQLVCPQRLTFIK